MKNIGYIWKIPILVLVLSGLMFGQTIKGTVNGLSGSAATPLVGVNIVEQGTSNGTTSAIDGSFSLSVSSLPVVLVFEYIGYQQKTLTVSGTDFLTVNLSQDLIRGDDVVVVGSRYRPRTSITSPVPVDNIRIKELQGTAQVSFDKMMHYVVPSFNSTQQTISDATAHFDPADLRGLGPSRTLILINGKRKNPSALVYINDTPGKGDVGVDMNSIPAHAIERVEVLRDGASAQYGSDAIAGVINIILSDDINRTNVNAYSGITQEGDGFQFGANVNTGVQLGNNGFLNVSAGFSDQEETNRAGEPGADGLFGVDGTNPFIRANPDLGMRVGLPNMTNANVFFNSGMKLENGGEVYSYGGLVYRDGISYALYRVPYWIPDEFNLLHEEGTTYNGFQPTFETFTFDNQFTAGFRSQTNGWAYDISYNYGSNSVDYLIGNTLNLDLAEASPTEFNAGGYEFRNNIINLDINRQFQEKFFLGIGAEYRQENFVANAGEADSYFGSGAQSFPGLQPQNEADANRSNVGAYIDVGADFTENFFAGAAVRYEDYSDFGTSVTYKVNARIKDQLNRYVLRGSVSTGFRAPSLHQIHLSIIQTLISGGTVSNQGTFDNSSPVLRKLGVDQLKEEESLNFTLGLAARPVSNLYLSLDFFQIDLDDRIVYSSSIASSDTNTTVGEILQQNNITSLKFFINAVNTRTRGVDFVANYQMDKLGLNLAASFYDHEIEGRINTPDVLVQDGIDIFDRKEQSRILSSRPNQKIILGATYDFNPFVFGLTATNFGEVTWQHASDPDKDQTFSAKALFDLNLSYRIRQGVGISLLVNNLLDTYPDEIDTKGDVVTDLGGRFRYPWEVNQFGFNGRTILGSLNLSL